ncbi:hypothetical protein [Alkalicoccus daliensis]|uniref:Uncharacterized protein n=1 Tax=Alkalicoccus daliensis TaxID=745820 RepID=A0A1H0FRT6_9BACI|nr:hypothetical protein [Alkalicoccus daliensis]SDN97357.1 hypothetical protein SAMN04488053_10557 [Alkalicoccus daliensis]
MGANDPVWIFILMYILFYATFVDAMNIFKQGRRKFLSLVMMVITPVHFGLAFVNSMGRGEGVTELQHLFHSLMEFQAWAVIVILAYVYILVWWLHAFFTWMKTQNIQQRVDKE